MSNKKISTEILALCAQKAVLSTEGVAEMAEGPASLNLQKTIKGIRLQKQSDKLHFEVYLKIKLNFSIPKTAWKIQENVKQKVEALSNIPVFRVDIHILGVLDE